jgi:hypothetical protein
MLTFVPFPLSTMRIRASGRQRVGDYDRSLGA